MTTEAKAQISTVFHLRSSRQLALEVRKFGGKRVKFDVKLEKCLR